MIFWIITAVIYGPFVLLAIYGMLMSPADREYYSVENVTKRREAAIKKSQILLLPRAKLPEVDSEEYLARYQPKNN